MFWVGRNFTGWVVCGYRMRRKNYLQKSYVYCCMYVSYHTSVNHRIFLIGNIFIPHKGTYLKKKKLLAKPIRLQVSFSGSNNPDVVSVEMKSCSGYKLNEVRSYSYSVPVWLHIAHLGKKLTFWAHFFEPKFLCICGQESKIVCGRRWSSSWERVIVFRG